MSTTSDPGGLWRGCRAGVGLEGPSLPSWYDSYISHHRSLLSGVTKRHLPIVYIIINSTSMVGIHQAATQQDLIARCITAAPQGETRGSPFVEPRTKGVNSRHLPEVTDANLCCVGTPIRKRDLGISSTTTTCTTDTTSCPSAAAQHNALGVPKTLLIRNQQLSDIINQIP